MANNTKVSTKRKGSKKARRRRRRILLVIEILVLLILLGVLFVVSKLDKIQQKDIPEDEIQVNDMTEEMTETLDGYTNIALFGLDSRTGSLDKGTHSDTIIIASINNKTKEVKLVSVYRDTFLNQASEDRDYHKANQAYFDGGPKQAINMINTNLDLDIKDYVSIDFNAIVATVNALGGIEVDVQKEEIVHLNNYAKETSEVTGVKTTKITEPGMQTLDGVQATSYARIRYTAGDDFKRTERQREVINLIAEKAKKASLPTLLEIVDEVFPMIQTSLSYTQIVGMAKDVAAYNLGETAGFPFEKTTGWVGKMSCVLVIDLEQNDRELHDFLFDGESYEPSSKVKEISQTLIKKTGIKPDTKGISDTSQTNFDGGAETE